MKKNCYSFLKIFEKNSGISENVSKSSASRRVSDLVQSDVYQKQIEMNWSYGTQQNIGMRVLEQLSMCFPSLSEQAKIGIYLDEKVRKINEVIRKQEKVIEKLKEYRLSVITEAVTKGLNPNVEMKDSGIEWIGKIPIDWDVSAVGHISTVVRGASPRPAGDPRFFDGNYLPWITVSEVTNVSGKYLYHTQAFLTKEGAENSRIVEEGTLLLSNSGATLGVPRITKIRGCINDGSVAFYNLHIEQEYLLYVFESRTLELRKQMQGYGQPNLNTAIIKEIYIPLPTTSCQKDIVKYLDNICDNIAFSIERRKEIIARVVSETNQKREK